MSHHVPNFKILLKDSLICIPKICFIYVDSSDLPTKSKVLHRVPLKVIFLVVKHHRLAISYYRIFALHLSCLLFILIHVDVQFCKFATKNAYKRTHMYILM